MMFEMKGTWLNHSSLEVYCVSNNLNRKPLGKGDEAVRTVRGKMWIIQTVKGLSLCLDPVCLVALPGLRSAFVALESVRSRVQPDYPSRDWSAPWLCQF